MPKLTARSSPRRSAVSFHARIDSGMTTASIALGSPPFAMRRGQCRPSSEHQPLEGIFIGDKLQHRYQRIEGKHQRDPEQNDAGGGDLGPARNAVQQQRRQQSEDKSVGRDKPLAGNAGNPIPSTIASAAPNAAEETPSVNGLASGLLGWSAFPPRRPRARPTTIAISA